ELVDPVHLRLEKAHPSHALEALLGQRIEEDLHDEREERDGDSPFADIAVDEAEELNQAKADKAEPAEINDRIELISDGGERFKLFRARVQLGADEGALARREGQLLAVEPRRE